MIDAQDLKDLVENLPDVSCSEPFEPGVEVFKVAGKVFAVLQPGTPEAKAQVTLKCQPDRAIALRAQYSAIIPGYHMNSRRTSSG